MSIKLHASQAGDGPPVILLHGLFGAGTNLGGVARSLQNRFAVSSVDLPNHGRSEWLTAADLGAMSECLRAWMLHHGLKTANLLGHSLGGKVAMQLALSHPELVSSLVVADIAPVQYPPQHDGIFSALDAVVAANCTSRQVAAELMAEHIDEPDVIQFLLTSLRRSESGSYNWRFNLEGIKLDYASMRAAPASASSYLGPVLFIKGGDSAYIRQEHRSKILSLFPQASVKVMPSCGHWLHAQKPGLFNSVAGRFLDAQLS